MIERLVQDEELIRDPEVQRQILIYGMENNDGLAMEVAFTIASYIDMPRFFREAQQDSKLFRRLTDLWNTLLTDPIS